MVIKAKQQGVVLLVTIVLLIALSSAASILMLNTSTDMKMAGASQEKVVATQEAIGVNAEVIYRQVNLMENDNQNGFTYSIAMYPKDTGMSVPVTGDNVEARIHRSNDDQIESDCPHSRMASSIQVFKCNLLTVRTVKGYGKKVNAENPQGTQLDDDKYNKVEVTSGVAQQLLNLGN